MTTTLDHARPWRDYPIVAIDFETSGPDPLTAEPVEVAAVRFEPSGAVGARFSSLLRPSAPIPADATAVHGITDAMVAEAPTLIDVGPELAAVCEGAIPLAYNRGFDRAILHRYLAGAGVPAFEPAQRWICVFAMAWSVDRYEPGAGRLKLTACCERRGINIVGAHRAEADAIAAGMLFHSIMAGSKAIPALGTLLDRIDETEAERERDYETFRKKIRAEERVIWRQYAIAALGAQLTYLGSNRIADVDAFAEEHVAKAADAMLAAERARFVEGRGR